MLNADLFRDRRSQLAKVVLLVCGFYFGLAFAGQAWKARGLAQTLAAEEGKLARQEATNAALRVRLEVLEGPGYEAYAEGVARSQLGMVKPGDRAVFVVPDEDAPSRGVTAPLPPARTQPAAAREPDPVWRQWVRLFFP